MLSKLVEDNLCDAAQN